MNYTHLICRLFLLFFLFWPSRPLAMEQVERVIEGEAAILKQGQVSQVRIDAVSDETQALLQEYRELIHQKENLVVYNDNLKEIIQSQEIETASLRRQIADIEVTKREIVPLMLRMLETLDEFIAADLPFLTEERQARTEGLRSLMRRADVKIPEKFRQIMLAYQTESDYGRTIEAFQGELHRASDPVKSVEFLRIGRLVLAYQTLDHHESGYWDAGNRGWVPLDGRAGQAIRQGIKIASRQAAPELIRVPVMVSESYQNYPYPAPLPSKTGSGILPEATPEVSLTTEEEVAL